MLVAGEVAATEQYDRQLPGLARDDLQSTIIEALFDRGADPRGVYAEIAIYEAVKHGQPKNLAVLLARGVPANKEYPGEYTSHPRKLLTFAAESGREEIVALLLKHGADPNTRNNFPYEFLRFHGTPAHRYRDNRKTALMYAAEVGNDGVVRQLLEAGANPNLGTYYDETALMLAAGKGCLEAVRALIGAKARLNDQADDESFDTRSLPDYGGTALGYALRAAVARATPPGKCGDLDNTISELLGAYERTRTRVGNAQSVVSVAVLRGEPTTVSRLVALGAVQRGGNALLNVGMRGDHPELVRILAAAGADVNARMKKPYDETALMRAAYAGSEGTVSALLDAGADVNGANTFGETPLWLAARQKRVAVVDLLLKRGADPNLLTRPNPQWFSDGGNTLNVAVEKDCMECARLLLARGANPRVADSNGRTPEEALRKAGLVP